MTDLTAATQACIDRVYIYDNVSFPELAGILETHGIPAEGELAMELSKAPNTLLWAEMSDEFLTIAGSLYDHPHIELRPAHVLTYLCDGGLLRLPIAKRPPKRGYTKPHWCPAVFVWTRPRDRRDDRQIVLAALTEDAR